MINGVSMNKPMTVDQWGNWGGLNDATRNQEFTVGTAPSDYTSFGGILELRKLILVLPFIEQELELPFPGTNTNYTVGA
jgi:hypothetical protein